MYVISLYIMYITFLITIKYILYIKISFKNIAAYKIFHTRIIEIESFFFFLGEYLENGL